MFRKIKRNTQINFYKCPVSIIKIILNKKRTKSEKSNFVHKTVLSYSACISTVSCKSGIPSV